MDRFIADAVKETILFSAEEGRESGLSQKPFGTIFCLRLLSAGVEALSKAYL